MRVFVPESEFAKGNFIGDWLGDVVAPNDTFATHCVGFGLIM
ncbi:hypothetical protein [Vibrio jasicida]|nr:hypothetical protein [Vibrio jasicida]